MKNYAVVAIALSLSAAASTWACSPEPKNSESGTPLYLECYCKSLDYPHIKAAMSAFPVTVTAGHPNYSSEIPGYGQCGFTLSWSTQPTPKEKCKEIKTAVLAAEDKANKLSNRVSMNASDLSCF